MPLEFVTIGVYGWDAERFFAALKAAQVDTFCDIRDRRGVRGAEYAFATARGSRLGWRRWGCATSTAAILRPAGKCAASSTPPTLLLAQRDGSEPRSAPVSWTPISGSG